MTFPTAQQTFGLGTLLGPQGADSPRRVTIDVEGRGVFAKVRFGFDFDPSTGDATAERLFLLEKPWDAVASAISVNGESLRSTTVEGGARALPQSQLQVVESALPTSSSHLLVVEVASDVVLTTVEVELVLAVDLQWHRGAFLFCSPNGQRQVDFSGRWDLAGLPGAAIAFTQAAAPCRLETLESARHRWHEPLLVSSDEPAAMEFSLDEKKAASIAVFSPSYQGDGLGCAAVAVVAPDRTPQGREPVRLAVLVEIRNPQESLLIRSMLEKVAKLLKPEDELSLFLLGTDSPSCLASWSGREAVDDELLARLLEPSVLGRSRNLWETMQSFAPQLRVATHMLVASSGAPSYPDKELIGHVPVFIFTTGLRPFRSQLESLSQRSGGFLMEGSQDSLDVLVERLQIRLSPPLLSDFKLEGWALEQLRPAGATQVYTDQPTVVYGLFEGLLPKTVTLSGQSPSRQKLAQRVRVESLDEIALMALYKDRVARWDGKEQGNAGWEGPGVKVRSIPHAEALAANYVADPEPISGFGQGMEIDMGGPSLISFSAAPIELDDSPLGAPPSGGDHFFQGEFEPLGSVAFEGVPGSVFDEPDLFASETLVDFSAATLAPRGESSQETPTAESELFEAPLTAEEPSLEPLEEMSLEPISSESSFVAPDHQELTETPLLKPIGEPLSPWASGEEGEPVSPEPVGEVHSPASSVPAPTTHGPSPGWSSQWLESFQDMDPSLAQQWLESCSIDSLGLAVSLLQPETAEQLLGRLAEPRQRAVRCQMEWGRLLESYECEEADRQLAVALTQVTL